MKVDLHVHLTDLPWCSALLTDRPSHIGTHETQKQWLLAQATRKVQLIRSLSKREQKYEITNVLSLTTEYIDPQGFTFLIYWENCERPTETFNENFMRQLFIVIVNLSFFFCKFPNNLLYALPYLLFFNIIPGTVFMLSKISPEGDVCCPRKLCLFETVP